MAPAGRSAGQGLAAALALLAAATAAPVAGTERPDAAELLARMTLEEKVGQLNLLSGDHAATGPYIKPNLEEAILRGEVGGIYNAYGAAYIEGVQRMAVERTRLGIPLLVGLDVIHGYRTIFPVPLAQAASFDLEAIERAERIAAVEAAAAGVSWTFAPMLDVARDPRWGRMVEGAGESPWLAARIAAARVRGFQGEGQAELARPDRVAGCAKHFAGYGAVEAGREYAGADISERALRETHLPAFEAAVRAGVPCVMAAFTTIDGVPGTANARLLQDVLRGEWGFEGFTVSDFGSVEELRAHGLAADIPEAARLAFMGGTDMDMQSEAFRQALPDLVRAGLVPEPALDRAVARVLAMKEQLGLLADPYARSSTEREAGALFTDEHRLAARTLAERSLVLLKNDGPLLPLAPGAIGQVALIGPLADSGADTLGPWPASGRPGDAITLKEGLEAILPAGAALTTVSGGGIERSEPADIAAARAAAEAADMVVLALGERATMSGEAASRASIGLPGDQAALAEAVLATGKPVALVLFAGRPLILGALADRVPAILMAWFPGSMGGEAIARALTGMAEPSGRLPVSFPRSVGQIPIYHDQRPTGRPSSDQHYSSRYIDEAFTPRWPFGFGLGYTAMRMGQPTLDREVMAEGESLTATVEVVNEGTRRGTAVVQLYLRDPIASVSRPLRELRGVARVDLDPGERRRVALPVTEADLAFWRADMTYGPEPGQFVLMTGPHAEATEAVRFEYRPRQQRAAGEGEAP